MANLGMMEQARKLLDAAGRRAWKQEAISAHSSLKFFAFRVRAR